MKNKTLHIMCWMLLALPGAASAAKNLNDYLWLLKKFSLKNTPSTEAQERLAQGIATHIRTLPKELTPTYVLALNTLTELLRLYILAPNINIYKTMDMAVEQLAENFKQKDFLKEDLEKNHGALTKEILLSFFAMKEAEATRQEMPLHRLSLDVETKTSNLFDRMKTMMQGFQKLAAETAYLFSSEGFLLDPRFLGMQAQPIIEQNLQSALKTLKKLSRDQRKSLDMQKKAQKTEKNVKKTAQKIEENINQTAQEIAKNIKKTAQKIEKNIEYLPEELTPAHLSALGALTALLQVPIFETQSTTYDALIFLEKNFKQKDFFKKDLEKNHGDLTHEALFKLNVLEKILEKNQRSQRLNFDKKENNDLMLHEKICTILKNFKDAAANAKKSFLKNPTIDLMFHIQKTENTNDYKSLTSQKEQKLYTDFFKLGTKYADLLFYLEHNPEDLEKDPEYKEIISFYFKNFLLYYKACVNHLKTLLTKNPQSHVAYKNGGWLFDMLLSHKTLVETILSQEKDPLDQETTSLYAILADGLLSAHELISATTTTTKQNSNVFVFFLDLFEKNQKKLLKDPQSEENQRFLKNINLTYKIVDKTMPQSLKDLLKTEEIPTFEQATTRPESMEVTTPEELTLDTSGITWKILSENSIAFMDNLIKEAKKTHAPWPTIIEEFQPFETKLSKSCIASMDGPIKQAEKTHAPWTRIMHDFQDFERKFQEEVVTDQFLSPEMAGTDGDSLFQKLSLKFFEFLKTIKENQEKNETFKNIEEKIREKYKQEYELIEIMDENKKNHPSAFSVNKFDEIYKYVSLFHKRFHAAQFPRQLTENPNEAPEETVLRHTYKKVVDLEKMSNMTMPDLIKKEIQQEHLLNLSSNITTFLENKKNLDETTKTKRMEKYEAIYFQKIIKFYMDLCQKLGNEQRKTMLLRTLFQHKEALFAHLSYEKKPDIDTSPLYTREETPFYSSSKDRKGTLELHEHTTPILNTFSEICTLLENHGSEVENSPDYQNFLETFTNLFCENIERKKLSARYIENLSFDAIKFTGEKLEKITQKNQRTKHLKEKIEETLVNYIKLSSNCPEDHDLYNLAETIKEPQVMSTTHQETEAPLPKTYPAGHNFLQEEEEKESFTA